MIILKPRECNVSVFILFCLLVSLSGAGEWPTYRHDNARTGCNSETLAIPLAQDWVFTSTYPPRPAWSGPAKRPREGFELRHRVIFDDAFQVAVTGNLVYFGSSSDNKIYALDAVTGDEHWSFFTGGPVRLAPTVWKGRVFVGSDDGFVYCLKADDGSLLWKIRGGPNDEMLLGNQRMISRWPIRTGVLVDEGIAYFGAGIFPHENVYLYAVRAEDGALIWNNDTISQEDAYRNELSPQGYLLTSEKRLFVPSGRALPVSFDRTNGQMVFNQKYGWRSEQAGGVVGGTYALLADNQIYTGTQNHLLALDQNTGKAGFAWFPGRLLAVADDMAYLATGRELVAMKRSAYAKASSRRNSLEYKIQDLESDLNRTTDDNHAKLKQELKTLKEQLIQHQNVNITPAIIWRVPSKCDAELIISSNLVIAGGEDQVNIFDRQSGRTSWSAKVEGKARGLALANKRLYVSTDKGKIYCFSSSEISKKKTSTFYSSVQLVSNPYPEDKLSSVYATAAETIIMETGIKKGYCLILGAENGRLARELALRTDLTIIGIESDSEKAQAAKSALDAAGLYGERVTIHQGDVSKLSYSNYFANLIVSDSLLLTGSIPGNPSELARHLKPCGGYICLGTPAEAANQAGNTTSEQLRRWFDRLELGQCRINQANGVWAKLQRGPLSGSGKWTHQYADPGNTACSDDRILSGPLGLLWFGEPGPAPMVNRHNAAAAPLAVNGRLLIQGENIIMAYDSYNGMLLWKREIPGALRTRLKMSECSNLAASQDSLFVAIGNECLRLDAKTGQTRAVYHAPADSKGASEWGYLAYVDGILYGSTLSRLGVSGSVFAIDVQNGKLLWSHEGKNIANLTIAVGDGWLFFVDSSLSPEQRQALLRQDKSHLRNLNGQQAKRAEEVQKQLDARLAVALDARTGGKLWSRPVDVTDCSKIGIGGGELTLMYREGIVVLCGANANGHYWRQFLAGEFSRRRLLALSARSGEMLWARDANYRHRPLIIGDTVLAEPWAYDLKTGKQKMRTHPTSGFETPWQFLRPGHHCGAISACPQMLLMRSGDTSYYDLHDDSGIRHFSGHRLGCWINAIAADGLALAPEASAGCVCLNPITCSIALEPRPDRERWSIYSAGGSGTPIRHLAVNFGAPGDRRDTNRELWFGYPRPGLPSDRKAMGFSFDIQTEFFKGGDYFRQNSEAKPVAGTDKSWVFSSYGRGIKRCLLPLLNDNDGMAEYTVRLFFAELENEKPGVRIFDIKVQGQKVLNGFDLFKEAGGTHRAIVQEFPDVKVSRSLEIEFIPRDEGVLSMSHMPVLCGVEVLRTKTMANTQTLLSRP